MRKFILAAAIAMTLAASVQAVVIVPMRSYLYGGPTWSAQYGWYHYPTYRYRYHYGAAYPRHDWGRNPEAVQALREIRDSLDRINRNQRRARP